LSGVWLSSMARDACGTLDISHLPNHGYFLEACRDNSAHIPWPEAIWINALGTQQCSVVSGPSDLLDGKALAEMTQMIRPPHDITYPDLQEETVRDALLPSLVLPLQLEQFSLRFLFSRVQAHCLRTSSVFANLLPRGAGLAYVPMRCMASSMHTMKASDCTLGICFGVSSLLAA
jgi:hypothetical protein